MFAKARPVEGDPVSVLFNVHCFYPPCEEPPLPLCVQACCREGGGSKKKETIMSVTYSPVTDVPTTSRAGSSSGMSLYVEKSVTVI